MGDAAASGVAAPLVPTVPAAQVAILQRGREEYETTFAAMRAFTDARTPDTPDQIWIVEHDPVFTLGLGADPAHVHDAGPIPVVQTDRGGEVTYHGPGQAIAYLLVDLRRAAGGQRLHARPFVQRIEQAVIDTLAAYNLAGVRHPGAPGIYVADGPWQGAKIAALGVKVRASGCTYHGVSLNVDMDLAPYGRIAACGFADLASIDLRSLGVSASLAAVQQALAENLVRQIGLPPALPGVASASAA